MTTIEILAPYLPYDVEVETPSGRMKVFAMDKWSISATYPKGDNTGFEVGYDEILPVLFGFADLCTPLADGTVPAVEVAKIQFPSLRGAATAMWIPAKTQGYVLDEYGRLLVYFTQNFYDNELSAKSFNYLRRNHFAVGLTAEQYVRKQAI